MLVYFALVAVMMYFDIVGRFKGCTLYFVRAEEYCYGRCGVSRSIVLIVWSQSLYFNMRVTVTYDHRLESTGHPVRSAIHKLQIGRLVVGWVTTSEYLLLYVFFGGFYFNFQSTKGRAKI